MKTVPTTDQNFVKDIDSGALLNKNNDGLEAYRRARAAKIADAERLNALEHKMDRVLALLERIVD
jgi:hypothetical protein